MMEKSRERRVFILALDALDHRLVMRWRLKNLLQKKWGTFEISKEYFRMKKEESEGIPFSPKIWTSFITGRKPSEHGVKTWWVYSKPLERIRHLPVISWVKGKRKILRKIGIKMHIISRRDISGLKTIFDEVKPSIAIYVPAYNDPTFLHEKLEEAFHMGLDKYAKQIWEDHEERKKATLKALNENRDWKLFMTYFRLADLIGHLFYVKKPLRIMKAYLELNNLAGMLKTHVPPNTIFLIVSDHGMRASSDGLMGEHSKYAFWSLNIDTEWTPKDFTDFYPKIIEWTRGEV